MANIQMTKEDRDMIVADVMRQISDKIENTQRIRNAHSIHTNTLQVGRIVLNEDTVRRMVDNLT